MNQYCIKTKRRPCAPVLIRHRSIWLLWPHLMFFGPVYAKPALGEIFRFASQVPHFQICFSGTPVSDLLLRYPSFRFASQVSIFASQAHHYRAHGTQRPESEQGSDAMDKYSLLPSSPSEKGNHTPRLSLWDLRCMRDIQGVMKLQLSSPEVAGNHRTIR